MTIWSDVGYKQGLIIQPDVRYKKVLTIWSDVGYKKGLNIQPEFGYIKGLIGQMSDTKRSDYPAIRRIQKRSDYPARF